MKKLTAFVLSLVLCLSAAAPAFAAEGGELPGDLNGDRAVNGRDAVCAERFLEATDSIPSAALTDLNNDGEVNSDDVLLLKRTFAQTVRSSAALEATAAGKFSVTPGESGSAYLSFTPEKSGEYTFTPAADGDAKVWLVLYDCDGSPVGSYHCEEPEADGKASGLTSELEGGTTYYLELGADGEAGGSLELKITAAKPGFAFPLFSKGGWKILIAIAVISLGDVVATSLSRRKMAADAGEHANAENGEDGPANAENDEEA